MSHTTATSRTIRYAGLVALVVVFVAPGCEEKKKTASATTLTPAAVTAAKAITRDLPITRTYPGITQSPEQVQVTARVEGYLEARFFEEGDDVVAGQRLYLIQPDAYEAQVAQAQANIEITRANLAYAKREFERNEPLAKSGAVSQERWDRYAKAVLDAQGQLAAAEASLLQAKLNLSYCEVTSLIDGRIGATLIDVGNVVSPMSPATANLATVVQLDPMRVVFHPAANSYDAFVAARASGRVPVKVTIRQSTGDPLVYEGELDLIDNVAAPSTSTFLARAEFASPRKRVIPGQYAIAAVTLGTIRGAVLVPTAALQRDPQTVYVWIVTDGDTLERRTVTLGDEAGALTHVETGLKAGEVVVIGASPLALKSGAKVKPTVKTIQDVLKGEAEDDDDTSEGAGPT